MPTKAARKPLAIIALPGSNEEGHPDTDSIAAICDDGSFFFYSFRDAEWRESAGIPGTQGAARYEAENAKEAAAAGAEMLAGLNAAIAKQRQRKR